jgi:hypothetical protein
MCVFFSSSFYQQFFNIPLGILCRWWGPFKPFKAMIYSRNKKKKKKKSDGRDFLFSFFFFFFCGFIQQQKKIFSFSSFLLNFSYKGGERDNGRKPACITRLISACAQTPHFLTYTQTHCLVNCVHTNPHFLKK